MKARDILAWILMESGQQEGGVKLTSEEWKERSKNARLENLKKGREALKLKKAKERESITLHPIISSSSEGFVNLKRERVMEEEREEPIRKSVKHESNENPMSRIIEAGFGIMFPALLSMVGAMVFKSIKAIGDSYTDNTALPTTQKNNETLAPSNNLWNDQSIFR